MSLEEALKNNTAALEANTAALLGGKTTSKSTGGATNKGSKKDDSSGTTVDVIAKRFGAYLASGSAADKKKAKTNVKKLVDHYEVGRVSEVPEESFDEALEFLDQFEAGEDPFEGDGGDLM